jgi:hypothetical protein
MIGNFVTHNDLISLEPSLEQFKFDEEIDFDGKIAEAKRIMIAGYKNNGKDIKKLGTQLELPNDRTISTIDRAERLRIYIKTTGITGNVTGILSGNNDGSDDYEIVKDDIVINEVGTYTDIIDNPFYYYKLVLTGTITFTASMVEDVHELPWKYKAISLIYRSNNAQSNDVYADKADMYEQMYNDAMQSTLYAYDQNLDGDISDEESKTLKRVTFKL